MRAQEYSRDNLEEFWQPLQKWLTGLMPTKDTELAGGAKEMERYINAFILEISRLAGRYQDAQGKPITKATLHQLPTKALYLYMRKMKLPDAEINRILKSIKTKLGTGIKPVDVTSANLADDDATIQSIWGVADGATADMLIDKLIGVAAVRKMEIEKLKDTADQTAQQPQQVGQQTGQQAGQQSDQQAGQQSNQLGTTAATAAPATDLQAANNRIAMAQQALRQLAGVA
jgi:hypothetical protein